VVGIVQVKMPGEVIGRRWAGIVAIVFALAVGEKADWHEFSCGFPRILF
jgi:hypothetical protein